MNARVFPWLIVAFLATVTVTAPSVAQRGWVSGSVADSTGAPLAYANVVVEGAQLGAMTDKSGAFRFDAPAGRHSLRVMMIGYQPVRREISITPGKGADLRIVLDEPALPPKSRTVDVPVGPHSGHVTESQLVERYQEITEPVRWGTLEFVMRKAVQEKGDSVFVNLIAEGRNVSDSTTRVCGCFSFWDVQYWFEPSVIDSVRSLLQVNQEECGSRLFDCEPVVLAPDETLMRELSFAYNTKMLPCRAGEIQVTAAFFEGTIGIAWADTRCLVIGPLYIPVDSNRELPRR